jgi:hypothetical protein
MMPFVEHFGPAPMRDRETEAIRRASFAILRCEHQSLKSFASIKNVQGDTQPADCDVNRIFQTQQRQS